MSINCRKINSNKLCPICNGKLFQILSYFTVMDGNYVFECENDKDHKFWKNMREREMVLYFHPNSTNTSFDWIKCFKYDSNNNIIEIIERQ